MSNSLAIEKIDKLIELLDGDSKHDKDPNKHDKDPNKHDWKICSCLRAPLATKSLKTPDGIPRLIVDIDKLWKKRELRVYFLNGTTRIQDKIFTIAKEWEQYTNMVFVRATSKKDSDIRIDISIDQSAWSALGTDAETTSVTMHYGWFYTAFYPDDDEYHATVLHEFGHALGFEHELQHPFEELPWDKEKVYAEYKRTQGWSREEVDAQVLSRLPENGNYILDSKIDVDSIMCYQVDTKLLLQNANLTHFSNKRNHKLTSEDKHNAYAAYLFDFPAIGTKVLIKSKPQVLESFEMAARNDYINETRDIHNNTQGIVIAHHLTNGILVQFSNNDQLWYEPTSMTTVKTSDVKPAIKQKQRFFVGDRVRWSKLKDETENVGTIRYHKSKDLTKVTILISNQYIEVDPVDLTKRVFYYNWPSKGSNPSLSLDPFPLNTKVSLKKDKRVIMRGFDMAGRDDYEIKMEKYLGQPGIVVMQHQTNGLLIQFSDGQKYWFEPPCLDPSPEPNYTGDLNRILVNSKVKIIQKNVDYSGYVAHVCLNINNNDKVRLSIGDEFLEYPANYLQTASSFF